MVAVATSVELGLDAVAKIRLHDCIRLPTIPRTFSLVCLADVHSHRAACLSD